VFPLSPGKSESPEKNSWRSLKKERYRQDQCVDEYDRRYSSGLNDLNTLVERRWIEDRIGNGLILDAGTGTGRFATSLSNADRRIVALDSSAQMLERLQQKAPNLGLVRSDIYRIPAADNTFDGAVCMHVLFHLPDWKEVLKELARVVRPEGPVIFEMRSGEHVALAKKVLKLFGSDPSGTKSKNRSEHTIYARRQEVRQAMEDCGLQLQKTFAYDIGHAYYLAPASGILERLLAGSGLIKAAGARCELLTGRALPSSLAYRTLFLGRKI
jgi:ubiquinone/menaquinone biosynthesis C-methylase UbiE